MTNDELKQFYEKLYFLEAEARDKIHSRLQLPLTLIVAIIGAVAFLLQNYDSQASTFMTVRMPFLFFLFTGSLLLAVAMERFVRALHNHEYHFLPDSVTTAEYKELLEATYKDFADRESLVADALDKYVVGYYVEYAAFNTRINDRRAAYLHQCTGAIIGATLLFSAAFLIFYFGDLDKSRMKAATEVLIKQPIDVRLGK